MHEFRIAACFLVIATLFFGAVQTRAQDPQAGDAEKPKPAARSYPPVGVLDQDPSGDQDSAPPLQPDTRPLTGIQILTLGSPVNLHSYWQSGFQYSNLIRSTALNQVSATGWNSTSYVTGNLSLLESWSDSQLAVNYSGGGYFSTDSDQGNGNFQQFALAQTFEWRRWQLALIDQFSYLPEASFGFGVGTGISIPEQVVLWELPSRACRIIISRVKVIFTSVGHMLHQLIHDSGSLCAQPRSTFHVRGS